MRYGHDDAMELMKILLVKRNANQVGAILQSARNKTNTISSYILNCVRKNPSLILTAALI